MFSYRDFHIIFGMYIHYQAKYFQFNNDIHTLAAVG